MDQEVLSDIVPRLRNICSVFRLNSFPANSPWLTYPTSSLFGAISISVFVKMMLILSITAALIFQSGAAFCTCTSVSLMCPILPDSFTFCLQTLWIRALHYTSESSQIVGLITPSALWMQEKESSSFGGSSSQSRVSPHYWKCLCFLLHMWRKCSFTLNS